jgi:hypothetical protein
VGPTPVSLLWIIETSLGFAGSCTRFPRSSISYEYLLCSIYISPLWSSGQSSWLQIQRFGFLLSSVSGTGSTQPREYN